jgi:hypothetical protein
VQGYSGESLDGLRTHEPRQFDRHRFGWFARTGSKTYEQVYAEALLTIEETRRALSVLMREEIIRT